MIIYAIFYYLLKSFYVQHSTSSIALCLALKFNLIPSPESVCTLLQIYVKKNSRKRRAKNEINIKLNGNLINLCRCGCECQNFFAFFFAREMKKKFFTSKMCFCSSLSREEICKGKVLEIKWSKLRAITTFFFGDKHGWEKSFRKNAKRATEICNANYVLKCRRLRWIWRIFNFIKDVKIS